MANPGKSAELVDSRKKQLGMFDILDMSLRNHGSQMPTKAAAYALAAATNQEGSDAGVFGNTFYVLRPVQSDPKFCLLLVFNADIAKNYAENAKKIMERAYDNGYSYMAIDLGKGDDPDELRMAKLVVKQMLKEGKDVGYKMFNVEGGGVRTIIKLGPLRST